jgi:hypothetical protein
VLAGMGTTAEWNGPSRLQLDDNGATAPIG